MSNILSILQLSDIFLVARNGGIAMQIQLVKIAVRLSLAFMLCSAAFGQSITASLQGRVSDSSGAVLTNASVKATNTETGLSRSTTSDSAGEYKIASLPV